MENSDTIRFKSLDFANEGGNLNTPSVFAEWRAQLKTDIGSCIKAKCNLKKISLFQFRNLTVFETRKLESCINDCVIGCLALCPCCNAPCDLNKDHMGSHSTRAHRLPAVRGVYWAGSDNLDNKHDCNTLASLDFHYAGKPLRNFEKDYQWLCDQSINASSQAFWKWYIDEFQDELLEFWNKTGWHVPFDNWNQKASAQAYVDGYGRMWGV